ncbi:AAA family ATPase [Actinomadura sp. GTD37]|uniref:AAA family ATPase n=1 Tax=Actinomadura sp. GTD37 TaxID=1778030 RepID=UPI0035C0D264
MLVERAETINRLDHIYTDCASGNGAVVLMSGPVASGKTALLRRLQDRVTAGGGVFLKAVGSLSERALPCGVLDQLLAGVRLPTRTEQRFAPGAVAAELRDSPSRDTLLYLFGILFEILCAFVEGGPLVVAIDDAHYSDDLSLEFLLFAARRVHAKPILLVLTEDSRLQREYFRYRAEISRQPCLHQIWLDHLSESGTAELLAERAGPAEAREHAPAVHRMTGGNPLLIQAIADDQCVPIPGTAFAQSVLTCVYRCEPAVLNTARALAVLDGDATVETLSDVLGVAAEQAAEGLDGLTAAGLVAGGAFRHEAIRMAVLRDMLPADRAELHGRAARALHGSSVAATTLARHLMAAGPVDVPWGVGVLREAAEEAGAEGAADLAVSCLATARQLCADDRERLAIDVALLDVKWRSDPLAASRHLPALADAAVEGRLDRRRTASLVCDLLWYGDVERAREIVAVVERADPGGAALEPIRSGLGWFYPELLGMPRALDEADGERRFAQAVRLMRDARLTADTVPAMVSALGTLICAGRLSEALYWSGRLLDKARAQGAQTLQALFGTLRADVHLRCGKLETARREAAAAFTLLGPESWGAVVGLPLAVLVRVAVACGERAAAASYLDVPVPNFMFETVPGLRYLEARGRYHLDTDRPHAAINDFEDCRDLMLRWGLDDPLVVPWRVCLAEAHLALGEYDDARVYAEEQLDLLRPQHGRVRGQCLRILAALSTPEDGLRILKEAARVLRDAGDEYELALTMAELGRAYYRNGDERRARKTYRRVRECGDELPRSILPLHINGATPDSLLRDLHGPAGDLSDAELRVATLAAHGFTNREISAQLHITVSTVEQHLTRIYRKLQITRRADLALELGLSREMVRP